MNFSGKKVLDSNQFRKSGDKGLASQVDNNQGMWRIKENRIVFWKPNMKRRQEGGVHSVKKKKKIEG